MFERATNFLVKKHSLKVITAIFIISFLLLSFFVYKFTHDYALNEASKHIEDILIEHKAKHGYIEEKQKPVIYELQEKKILSKDFFAPEVLSFTYPEVLSFTYIARYSQKYTYLFNERAGKGRKKALYL